MRFINLSRSAIVKLNTDDNSRNGFRVQLIGSGEVDRGYYVLRISEKVIRKAIPLFEGTSAYTHMLGQHVPTFMYSEKDKVGRYSNVKYNKKYLEADLTLANTPEGLATAEQLDLALEEDEAYQQFSAVFAAKSTYVVENEGEEDERLVEIVTEITKVRSVDLVDEGAFLTGPIKKLSAEEFVPLDVEERIKTLKEGHMDKYYEMSLEELKGLDLEGLSDAHKRIVQTLIEKHETEAKLAAEEAARKAAEDANAGNTQQDDERVQALQDRLDQMEAQNLETYFDSQVEALGEDNPAVDVIRKNLTFSETSKDEIDALLEPIIALAASQWLSEHRSNARIQVTRDQRDTVQHLSQAMLIGQEVEAGGEKYEAFDSFDQFLNAIGQPHMSNLQLWDHFVDDYHQLAISSTSGWGSALQDQIIQAALRLYDESSFNAALEAVVSASRVVGDYNERITPSLGNYGNLQAVAEGGAVQAVTSAPAFRVPVTPVKYEGIERVSEESFTGDPVSALRNLTAALGDAAARSVYTAVFTAICTKALMQYETSGDNTAAVAYTTASGNLVEGNAAATVINYDNVLAGAAAMRGQQAYGGANYALGSINQPATLLAPPGTSLSAERITQSQFKPGDANNEVNQLSGISVEEVHMGLPATDFVLVADPRKMGVIVLHYVGQRTPRVRRDPSNRRGFTNNELEWKSALRAGYGFIDRRSVYLSRNSG